jgi:hypothetical protein
VHKLSGSGGLQLWKELEGKHTVLRSQRCDPVSVAVSRTKNPVGFRAPGDLAAATVDQPWPPRQPARRRPYRLSLPPAGYRGSHGCSCSRAACLGLRLHRGLRRGRDLREGALSINCDVPDGQPHRPTRAVHVPTIPRVPVRQFDIHLSPCSYPHPPESRPLLVDAAWTLPTTHPGATPLSQLLTPTPDSTQRSPAPSVLPTCSPPPTTIVHPTTTLPSGAINPVSQGAHPPYERRSFITRSSIPLTTHPHPNSLITRTTPPPPPCSCQARKQ